VSASKRRFIALVGFMASGKTSVAKPLARRLECEMYDTDKLIVDRYGPIPQIFSTFGEKKLREYEFETLSALVSEAKPGVIATGGGAATYDPTYQLLKEHTYRVFLWLPIPAIWTRLKRSAAKRPVAGESPSIARLEGIYNARRSRYEDADVVINAHHLKPNKVADQIVRWVEAEAIEL